MYDHRPVTPVKDAHLYELSGMVTKDCNLSLRNSRKDNVVQRNNEKGRGGGE